MSNGLNEEKSVKNRFKIKLNLLQTYIIIFFVIALTLLLISWFFQTRFHNSSKLYEDIIEKQKTTLTSNTSMMKDIQEKYLKMQGDYDKMKSETDARTEYISTLEEQIAFLQTQLSSGQQSLESEADLSNVQLLVNSKKTATAKNVFSRINREALSPKSKELYDSLKRLLY